MGLAKSYFDNEDEGDHNALEYLPAPGSPGTRPKELSDSDDDAKSSSSSNDEDPLDAFMAGIETEVKSLDDKKPDGKKTKDKGIRDDIEQEDDLEQYLRYVEENPNAGNLDDDSIIDYDEDGNPIVEPKKVIDPLPPIDHSTIEYKPFAKNFYTEHEEIQKLKLKECVELREKLGLKVTGPNQPKPVCSFAHFGFDEQLMKAIRKAHFTTPTPIQAQGIPVCISGRDVIGIAQTGSGKTVAYLWPMLVHIMDQPDIVAGDGPISLVLAPTRELAQQIAHECKKFGKIYNIRTICAYGGGSMYEQTKACGEGAEIIVCTPGRIIDLVKKKATKLSRVTYLVLDEADKMFNMGFALLFSATMKQRIEMLCRDILNDPVRIMQGDLGETNADVIQKVEVFSQGPQKWVWLTSHIVSFMTQGSVLIFVTRKVNSEELANNLKSNDFQVGLIHGDMHQSTRNTEIMMFKKREQPILVATDVAARGLDIPHIRTVVNYDVARDIDTHIHRCGRTGRAGEKGTAYTLVTPKDVDFCGALVRNLESSNQDCPQKLMDLALQSPWFKQSRFKKEKAKTMGGQGLGFKSKAFGGDTSSQPKGEKPANYKEYMATAGPQSDRVSAMRSAFTSQFRTSFVSASPETAWKSNMPPPAADPPKEKKKTRWD